ncbi:hypothetical protein STXM2123_4538 [Streptomyces sp. F-3]|nr:hypothetical protein STXM2123_4538 [Streptomyces sp. F-3]
MVTDERYNSFSGKLAGAATNPVEWGAMGELKQASRWRPGFRVFRAVHVRPAQAERDNLSSKTPIGSLETAA